MTLEMVPRPWDNEDEADEAQARAWHDFEVYDGRSYPVLWYTPDRDQCCATTEPCIWCGRRHRHGNMPGSRGPHCGPHTHETTPKGNRRSLYARGVTRCSVHHRDYILQPRPTDV